jgi:hypothetical protein
MAIRLNYLADSLMLEQTSKGVGAMLYLSKSIDKLSTGLGGSMDKLSDAIVQLSKK